MYTPSVLVVRGNEQEGYPYIKPYKMAMIACPGNKRGGEAGEGEQRRGEEWEGKRAGKEEMT